MALDKNTSYEQKLNQVLEKLRATSDNDSALSFNRENSNIGDSNIHKEIHPIITKAVIGQPAPYFEGTVVHEGVFRVVNSTDFLGKYLVLLFYPLDFSFVCPTEIIAFSNNLPKFKRLNTEIIACSTDSKFSHLAWLNTPREDGGIQKVKLPLLSDITHKISKDYGVYSEFLGHDYRGLYIIDHRGIIRQITINDLQVGRSVDEICRLVKAFQYTDTHGEVCPAGWEPGEEALVPDNEKAKEYFNKHKN